LIDLTLASGPRFLKELNESIIVRFKSLKDEKPFIFKLPEISTSTNNI